MFIEWSMLCDGTVVEGDVYSLYGAFFVSSSVEIFSIMSHSSKLLKGKLAFSFDTFFGGNRATKMCRNR